MRGGAQTRDLAATLAQVRKAFEEYAEAYQPNATYEKPPSVKEFMRMKLTRMLVIALATGMSIRGVGPAGSGKSTMIRTVAPLIELPEYGGRPLEVVVINMANTMIEHLILGFPVKSEHFEDMTVLRQRLDARLWTENPKLVLLEETNRVESEEVRNALMQFTANKTLLGVQIPHVVAVIALENPEGAETGEVVGMDFTQADRFATWHLDFSSTSWKRGLAAKYSDVDLSGVFRIFEALPLEARKILNPRVLDAMIDGLREGFPGLWSLPMGGPQGKKMHRQRLFAESGDDITDRTIDLIARELGAANPSQDRVSDMFARAVEYATRKGRNLLFVGPPGIAKTAAVSAKLESLGFHQYPTEPDVMPTLYVESAASLPPEFISIAFPAADGRTLTQTVAEKFETPEPWVWVVDDINRARPQTQHALMEPIQERTIGNKETNLRCTIGIANPEKAGEGESAYDLDIGEMDLAQASRFSLSIEVSAADIPWRPYLRATYGEDLATPFIEWWEDDLDDLGRSVVTARALERLILLHLCEEEDLAPGLPEPGGKPVKVPQMVDLYTRLSDRPLARLKAIVAKVDEYESTLASRDGGQVSNPVEHHVVYDAFLRADLEQLKANREVVVRLYRVLDQQWRIALFLTDSEVQAFWNEVLFDSDN